MAGFAEEMAAHDEEFQSQMDQSGTLPDGPHTATISENVLSQSDFGWSLMLRFQSEDGSIRKWYNLEDEEKRGWAAQDMRRLGYDRKLSELDQACENNYFIGLVCEIAVKTKPGTERDYTNVYVNRVLGRGNTSALATASATPGGATPPDDDIPF